jgi:predicted phosphate transport protein (TIGR00153 family)
MGIWRNEEKAGEYIIKHFNTLIEEFDNYDDCLRSYFDNGCNMSDAILEKVEKVHKDESSCDTIRREFKEFLYESGILPAVREDLMKLIDANDRIANRIEYVTDFYTLQKIHIFHSIIGKIYEMNKITREGLLYLKDALSTFLTNHDKAKELIKKVQQSEHEVDKYERKLIVEIFDMSVSLSEKMILRELINLIGDISDFSENSSDIINMIMIKRTL